jgi:outer membrane protein assembly factor BamB
MPPSASDWTTYNRDAGRDGVDPSEPPLGSLAKAWTTPVDGFVYAQPLFVGGRVFVATENNTVYALEAASGRRIWRMHLGAPVQGSDLPCGNIDISGITGTPVVDASSGVLFVVAFIAAPRHHELYALDIASGRVRWHRVIDPSGADPSLQQQRPALALANGFVYVAFGGLYGDCGAYHGWVVGVSEQGSGLVSYRVPSTREGGIWAPPGPSVDASGDLLVATGNSASASAFDYGNAVVRLSPQLRVVDWFADADWALLNRSDTDLGSTSPLPLRNGLVFQAGKAGTGYLLHDGHLGGVGGQVFRAPVCPAGAYGGGAYSPPFVYVACRDGVVALRVSGSSFSVAWRGPRTDAGPPIVAGGAVWTIDLASSALQALDPGTGHVRVTQNVGQTAHFAAPSSGAGRVYVPAGSSVVAFSGL